MNRIKILHISPDSVIYGTERHILSIVKYSDRNKFDHTVATPVHGIFNSELDRIRIKNLIAGRKPGYKSKFENIFNKDTNELFNLIKKEKYDIVHTHLNTFGGFVAWLAGAKIIFHTRHGVFWSEDELNNISFPDKGFQKIKSSVFDITIAIGEYEKCTMIKKLGYDPGKIRVTKNGVNVNEIESKLNPSITKEKLYNTDKVIAGAVGRLERQKGFEFFIQAINEIKDKIDNIKFVIIGDGSYKDKLINMRDEFGLKKNLEFISYKENILDYINHFDIKVLTSRWEGMSYAVQEAMALGKPVIALTSGSVSGMKEIIVDGVTGYLIEKDYISQLGEKILELASDPGKRKQMGEEGKKREREHFDESITARDMQKYYEEIFIRKRG
jgi:glycosyltransferase involved in cell wall biosynthesis